MARKTKTRTGNTPGDSGEALRDTAQKIWLAGLGAFERARSEGPRMFETLVEQGRNMGARAVGAADEALKAIREGRYSGADLQKLERLLEQGVSGSLSKLGIMTQRDIDALREEVRGLSERMRRMSGLEPSSTGSRKTGARRARANATTRKRKAAAPAGGRTGATRKARATATRKAGSTARKAATTARKAARPRRKRAASA